ncbi:MAG: hypothetical protein FJ267_15285, partial [Planctomycetes bacterium]|nr:hypothetical protein [Planctomycetota bacterium]
MTQRQNNWNEAKACKVENGATSTSSIETNTSKEYQRQIGRRSFLGQSAGLALTSSLLPVAVYCNQGQSKLPVAAIVTEYRVDSHADVIVGKIL